ncbi:Siderophore-interacting FAD-binding domain protein [Acetobacteraceae bacterium AT-5844]|nr:Siderophore-interacting FAD-binding domain protein [Acetobacteraceae bacterium AT-5844]
MRVTTLIAEAQARTANAETLSAKFREHMAEHGLEVDGTDADYRVAFPGGVASFRLQAGAIALRIEAINAERLAEAQGVVAGHLDGFAAGESLGIVWTGDGVTATGALPHNFRVTRVKRVMDVTPHMRRLTLTGEDLGRFDAEAMHVKIFIPAPGGDGREPVWPHVSASGQPVLDGCSLTRRTYTIRRIDVAAKEMDIDFVLHGDASPGSRFAMHARPGDWLGISGPGGGDVPLRGWTLIGGDETALPVIARALEAMPQDARGQVLIEVAVAAEEQPLSPPPGMALRWLHRNGTAPGVLLLEAIRNLNWPAGEEASAWVACEGATAVALREHFAQVVGLPRSHFRAVAYWRQGLAEGAGKAEAA